MKKYIESNYDEIESININEIDSLISESACFVVSTYMSDRTDKENMIIAREVKDFLNQKNYNYLPLLGIKKENDKVIIDEALLVFENKMYFTDTNTETELKDLASEVLDLFDVEDVAFIGSEEKQAHFRYHSLTFSVDTLEELAKNFFDGLGRFYDKICIVKSAIYSQN